MAGGAFFAPVFAGILRAMADDYGALATIKHGSDRSGTYVEIELLDMRHGRARSFRLARPEGV